MHYQELFEAASPTTASQEDSWGSTPMQYLEKIFQIPFTLPQVDHTGYATMIDALTVAAPRPGHSAPALTSTRLARNSRLGNR